VADFDFSVAGDAPEGDDGGLRSADDVVARAQRLIDAVEPYDGYPLEWYFEARNVGDLTAIAVAALRETRPEPHG
jgi:hypothetical protein